MLNVWDVAAKSVVASRTTPDTVSGMAWQPGANALLCITESSGIIVWSDVLPRAERGPSPSTERHARASDGERLASCALHAGARKPGSLQLNSLCCADGRASSLLDGSKGADLADFIERDTPEPSKPAPREPAGGTLGNSQRWPQPQGPIYLGSSPAGTPTGHPQSDSAVSSLL